MCTTKTCTKCGEDKPATLEYYKKDYGDPHRKRLNARCRTCTNKENNARYRPSIRKCPECNAEFTGSQKYCDLHINNRSRERRLNKAKDRLILGDQYVKTAIKANLALKGVKLSFTQMTPELIETQRKKLWISREKNN